MWLQQGSKKGTSRLMSAAWRVASLKVVGYLPTSKRGLLTRFVPRRFGEVAIGRTQSLGGRTHANAVRAMRQGPTAYKAILELVHRDKGCARLDIERGTARCRAVRLPACKIVQLTSHAAALASLTSDANHLEVSKWRCAMAHGSIVEIAGYDQTCTVHRCGVQYSATDMSLSLERVALPEVLQSEPSSTCSSEWRERPQRGRM